MAKEVKYSSRKSDDVEKLSEKLTMDLRHHIRKLGNFPILSSAWCDMADVLGRIAHISEMEAKLAESKDEATLWETEELALRYLLEDGKLNLCLRALIEYKQYQREYINAGLELSIENAEKCEKFEKGLGVIMKNVWSHVEAVQTTDMHALMNHIADTVEYSLSNSVHVSKHIVDDNIQHMQEFMIFDYLVIVIGFIDHMQENRERGVFLNVARFLLRYNSQLGANACATIIRAMSLISGTEDFATFRDSYVGSVDDVEILLDLRSDVFSMFQHDMEKRKMMRPLNDTIDQLKRKYRLK